jgi:DNA primase
MSSGVAADIKSKLTVVEIVGETVVLKRAGAAYKGLCPFHGEKTPSFVVSPDRETWHCFGCGEGGDIFSFVMRRDGLDFKEALSQLAERAGVELTARTAGEDRRNKRLREALEKAIAWYREVLLQTRLAERAREYLAERGLTEQTLDRFGIGYAPNTWDAMTKRLRAMGFTDGELVTAGLASEGRRGPIDRFRGRIIIPIRDQSGRAIGLGGRILPGSDGPKYLNSPATPLFDKSRTLYAIDLAKTSIRREKLAVIVEGYTDVMAAHQAGFTNVVASLGTALTRGQVELAVRYADAVALAYDVDVAGETATQRSIVEELGPDHARKVRVIRIPAGKDPDELIRSDPDAWRRAIDDAKEKTQNLMDYFLERETAGVDERSIDGRLAAAERVLRQLARFPDPLWRGTYVQELARRLNLSENDLRERLNRGVEPTGRPAPRPTQEAPAGPSLPVAEATAIELVLRHPALVAELPGDAPTLFHDAAARALVAAWRERHANDGGATGLEAFVESLDPASAELARQVLASGSGAPRLDPEQARDALRDCVLRMRVRRTEEAIADARLVLEEAQRDGNREEIERIEQRINQLGREKAEVTRAIFEGQPVAMAGARRT